MQQYYPSNPRSSHELVIKKSRFITYVAHTPEPNTAREFIAEIQHLHPKANHHCSAYIAGSRALLNHWGCSDDGEPKGTAGKPMLNVLEHSELCEITVVVVRYFGGIKLGAGGLVRAYSQAVQQAIENLAINERVETFRFSLEIPHHFVGDIERHLSHANAVISERVWGNRLTIHGEGSEEALQYIKEQLTAFQHLITYSDQISKK